ncbi:MAG: 4Fe-4S binding protein [Pirellulales bacterium]|nr:4Fe-4S binding protein [Pirellulales bacterium]
MVSIVEQVPGMSVPLKWLPSIDEESCTGCRLCVEACSPASLALVEDKAMLVRADTCGSEEHCIGVCPEDAIRMEWLPGIGDRKVGKWADVPPQAVAPLKCRFTS